LGKHPETTNFNKGKDWRASKVLDMVQSDVVNPFPSLSFSKAHYLLTFLDTLGSTFFNRKKNLLIDSRSSRLAPRNNLRSASKFSANNM
jgi:hypothetical protein